MYFTFTSTKSNGVGSEYYKEANTTNQFISYLVIKCGHTWPDNKPNSILFASSALKNNNPCTVKIWTLD
jgi:hypothetical protein